MALRISLILRKSRSDCLEGRTALIQPVFNFFTRSLAGVTGKYRDGSLFFEPDAVAWSLFAPAGEARG
jgi:hypothetical protein